MEVFLCQTAQLWVSIKETHLYSRSDVFKVHFGKAEEVGEQFCKPAARRANSAPRIWYVKRDPHTAPQQLSLERGATHISDGLYFTPAGSYLICGAVSIFDGTTNNSFLLTPDLFALQPPSFLMQDTSLC